MRPRRPFVLCISGLDPSAGAGLLADIKTVEANKAYGLGVCTAITIQNDKEVLRVDWLSIEQILDQCKLMLSTYPIHYCKIGIVSSIEFLQKLVDGLLKINKSLKIIWDPIMSSTSGFHFSTQASKQDLLDLCKSIYVITPNYEEARKMLNSSAEENCMELSSFTNVFLKGGHNQQAPGKDYLFTSKKQYSFNPKKKIIAAKHGSGCVFSSSLAVNLANGFKLHASCLRAKNYTARFLNSNSTNLGYHRL